MFIIRLAREVETRQGLIDIIWIVDYEIIALGLTWEQSIHALWIEPFFAHGFTFHFVETRVKLCFQLFPFFTMCVFRAPRETIEFVDIEMCQNNFEWHVLDDAHTELGGGQSYGCGCD